MDDDKPEPEQQASPQEQRASNPTPPPTQREQIEKLTEIRKNAGGVLFDTGEPQADPFETILMPIVGDSPDVPASSGDSSSGENSSSGGDAASDTASE